MDKYMIEINNVSKKYKLGQIGGTTLREELQRRRAKRRGMDDPNRKIGSAEIDGDEEFWALEGISLQIKPGEKVGIIGKNGAGKSTLLKLISRITTPTTGEIGLNGRVTSMLEVGTGFHGELTGRENIYMNGAILGMTKAEIDAKMEDIIDFSEVREFIDTPVKRYSSGMYVKLAFSVAAHLDSEIMIMDEVLAVGDMAFQKKCLDKMRDASNKEGKTILYVSHNMNTIRQLCDRCIVLNKGKIVFNGDVEKAIEIYLGERSTSKSFIDLENIPRDEEFNKGFAKMLSFEVLNNESSIYPVGSKMIGRLVYKCNRDIDEVFYRITIKTTDGEPVTMVTTEHGMGARKGIKNEFTYDLDLSHIAPGRYVMSPILFEVDESGMNVNLDVIKDLYTFEVAPVEGFNHNMPWLSRYWGYFYCDSIKQLEYKEI